jgi:predicted O-methyltransferase YrrM
VSKRNKPNPWLETDPARWTGRPLQYYTAVASYFQRFRRGIFVETGTLVGNGLWCALEAGFGRCYSIEIHPHQHAAACERFRSEIDQGRVELLLGDSGEVLPAVMDKIDQPALFWLDAHLSHNYGERLAKACPALEELDAIDQSAVRDHVILIDDVACFDNATHDNIPLQAVKDRIAKINPAYQFEQLDAVLPGNILAAWVA